MIDWEGILSRDGPAVWQTAWRVLGNRADADECFQEAFVAALEYSRTRTVTHWRALLQRLAAARAIDRLRQRVRLRNRETLLGADQLVSPTAGPSDQAQAAELAANLRSALSQIPSNHANVFWLYHREGWSYAQIAESMDVSVDLVGVWLQRARQRLRELLASINDATKEVPS